jgi:hypothetical protein
MSRAIQQRSAVTGRIRNSALHQYLQYQQVELQTCDLEAIGSDCGFVFCGFEVKENAIDFVYRIQPTKTTKHNNRMCRVVAGTMVNRRNVVEVEVTTIYASYRRLDRLLLLRLEL